MITIVMGGGTGRHNRCDGLLAGGRESDINAIMDAFPSWSFLVGGGPGGYLHFTLRTKITCASR